MRALTKSKQLRWTIALAVALGSPATISSAPASTGAAARCPLKPSSSIPSGEAWAFTATGAPVGAHPGIRSVYAHGRGTWTHGRGAGTICRSDVLLGAPTRDIVLKVAGRARVSAGVTELGRRGASLTLGVSVSASDDPACAIGARGSVSIFASYYGEHRDRVQLRFATGCAGEDATFAGPQLRALIARDGRQVNHP